MKKLTAGIFAGILTVVAVNAAHADIATTSYVQGGVNAAKTYTDTKVGDVATLNTTNKTNTVAAINEVNTAVKTVAGNMVADSTVEVAEADKTKKYPSIAYTEGLMEGYVSALGYDGKLEEQANKIEALKTQVGTTPVADQITAKVNTLNKNNAVADGNYITAVNEANGIVTATTAAMDTAPTADSKKPVTSAGIKSYVDTAVSGATTDATGKINALTTRVTTAEGKIGTLQDTVGNATSGLVKDVADLKTDNTTNKSNISALQTADTNINAKIGAGFDATNTVAKAIADAKSSATTATDGLDTRLTAAEKAITDNKTAADNADKAINDKIGGTYSATSTVADAIADARQAGTDAADALDTYKTAQAATDKTQSDKIAAIEGVNTTQTNAINTLNANATTAGSVDYKIAQAQTTINNSINNKVTKTNLNGKMISTTAAGELQNASTGVTGCTANTEKGISCILIAGADGTLKLESVVDKYTE